MIPLRCAAKSLCERIHHLCLSGHHLDLWYCIIIWQWLAKFSKCDKCCGKAGYSIQRKIGDEVVPVQGSPLHWCRSVAELWLSNWPAHGKNRWILWVGYIPFVTTWKLTCPSTTGITFNLSLDQSFSVTYCAEILFVLVLSSHYCFWKMYINL